MLNNKQINFQVREGARKGLIISKWLYDNENKPKLPHFLHIDRHNLIKVNVDKIIIDKHEIKDHFHVIPIYSISLKSDERMNVTLELYPQLYRLNIKSSNYSCTLANYQIQYGVLLTPNCVLYFITTIKHLSTITIAFHNKLLRDSPTYITKYTLKLPKQQQILSHNFHYNSQIHKLLLIKQVPNQQIINKIQQLYSDIINMASTRFFNTSYLLLWLPRKTDLSGLDQNHINYFDLDQYLCRKNNKSKSTTNDCSNNGKCIVKVIIDYNIDNLLIDINETFTKVLADVKIETICKCFDGYLGEECQYTIPCKYKKICHNGGQCVNQIGKVQNNNSSSLTSSICLCSHGYVGSSCQGDLDECRLDDNENNNKCGANNYHGRCINLLGGGYRCECDVAWSGTITRNDDTKLIISTIPQCSIPLNHCDSSSSSCVRFNTRKCIPTLSSYICVCKFGYYGKNCEYSTISFHQNSFVEYHLSTLSNSILLSFEFASLCHDCILITWQLSLLPSSNQYDGLFIRILRNKSYQLIIQLGDNNQNNEVVIKEFLLASYNNVGSQWQQLITEITRNSIIFDDRHMNAKLNINAELYDCEIFGGCDTSMSIFSQKRKSKGQASFSTGYDLRNDFRLNTKVIIGSFNKKAGFLGCVRAIKFGRKWQNGSKYFQDTQIQSDTSQNVQIVDVSNTIKHNIAYDGCPRYKDELSDSPSSPCHPSRLSCNRGTCVDEWFWGYCQCPLGWESPYCTPGYNGYQVSSGTVILVNMRKIPSPSLSDISSREKREISSTKQVSSISLRIRTTQSNAILMASVSSEQSYSILKIHEGHILWLENMNGVSRELVHKETVNDNQVHIIMVTVDNRRTGSVILTVDNIQAIVEWKKPYHNFLVTSVYLFGLPKNNERLIPTVSLRPSFDGCVAHLKFNNISAPLTSGISQFFNTTVQSGSPLKPGCESRACYQPDSRSDSKLSQSLCGRFQHCREVDSQPHSIWGRFYCHDDSNQRLMAILIPVIITVILFVILFILICKLMKRRTRKLKQLKSNNSNMFYSISDKNKLRFVSPVPLSDRASSSNNNSKERDQQKIDLIQKKTTPRSITSSTLLMQELDRPDLIHDIRLFPVTTGTGAPGGPQFIQQPPFYSSPQYIHGNPLSSPPAGMQVPPGGVPVFYHCSHPDDYEPVGSLMSSSCSNSEIGNSTTHRYKSSNMINNGGGCGSSSGATSGSIIANPGPLPCFTPTASLSTVPHSSSHFPHYSLETPPPPQLQHNIIPINFYPPPPPLPLTMSPSTNNVIATSTALAFTPSASSTSSSSTSSSAQLQQNSDDQLQNNHQRKKKNKRQHHQQHQQQYLNNKVRNKKSNSWINIQRALPPPPSTSVSTNVTTNLSINSHSNNNNNEQHYDYADSNAIV